MTALPDSPSDLIELALRDLEAVEQDRKYFVDMGSWHSPIDKPGVCHVCLAGAVMAKSLKISRKKHCEPWDMEGDSSANKLRALDWFRRGNVAGGLRTMGKAMNWNWIVDVPQYKDCPKAFKKKLTKLVATLRRMGL